jgi:hypothetical protein
VREVRAAEELRAPPSGTLKSWPWLIVTVTQRRASEHQRSSVSRLRSVVSPVNVSTETASQLRPTARLVRELPRVSLDERPIRRVEGGHLAELLLITVDADAGELAAARSGSRR